MVRGILRTVLYQRGIEKLLSMRMRWQ